MLYKIKLNGVIIFENVTVDDLQTIYKKLKSDGEQFALLENDTLNIN